MNFNPDDPRWTAYALGELDPAERARLDQVCETNPAARKHVEEIRALAGGLKKALATEPALELRPNQKAALQAKPEPKPILRFPLHWAVSLGAAAALVAMIGMGLVRMTTHQVGSHDTNIQVALVEPEAIELERFEKDLETIDALQEMPVLDVDMPAPSSEPAPAPQESAPDLAGQIDMSDHFMLAMNGNFAGRSSAGRASALRAYGGKFKHAEVAPPSGIISPSQDDYDVIHENPFQRVTDHPLSTFSIDVDSASYAVVRRYLTDGQLPPKDAVRIEELVNYFTYSYAPPTDGRPFAVHLDAAPCPWNPAHQLARVAIKARELDKASRPAVNLVFLIDVSGSMSSDNKLPLVKRSLQTLAKQLDERDRLAIVVYAGAAGTTLPTTRGDQTQAILEALERLESGGSTAGGAGIQLAYATAREQFVKGGVNRVILCTDGDFNVGLTQRGDLESLIETEAKSGVYLTVLGFGMGNYKDSTLELLSNKGNGNYGYVDDFSEARRLLVDQMLGTLVTVAKDVKIQVEFNPARVAGYRLVGYENRMLRKEDFNNDKIDAGDVGAGHNVTAFYELIPVGQSVPGPGQVDELKYQAEPATRGGATDEILTAKLRYKHPDGDTSVRMDVPLTAGQLDREPGRDFRFASAVAGFGMILRDSPLRGSFGYADVLNLAEPAIGEDPGGYRREFINLVRNAQALAGKTEPAANRE